MRPLAVLILVLGAAAALLFAVVSLLDTDAESRGGAVAVTTRDVRAADKVAERMDPVVEPDTAVARPERASSSRDVVSIEGAPEPTGAFANYLEGQVVDPDGVPVAGATVSLFERQVAGPLADVLNTMNGNPDPRPVHERQTGNDGRFRFGALKPGRKWTVAVEHPDYSPKEVGPIDVPEEGGIEERIVLESGYLLQGYVRDDASGAPIRGARVELGNAAMLWLPSPQRGAAKGIVAETDANGLYRFANIPPGQQGLTCSAPGYGRQLKMNISFMGSTEKVQHQDFRLKEAMIIAGRVLGPDRSGVEGVVIDAFSNNTDPGSRSTATSKAGGEFLLEGLAPGFYTLRAFADGWDVDPVLRVEAGTTDAEVQLFEQGAVMGKVVDSSTGRPLHDFQVSIRKLNQQSKAWGGLVTQGRFQGREDGSFQIGGISEGTYVAQGDARGYASSFSEQFTVSQGLTTPDIVVKMSRGGTVKGRVIDSYTGAPVARATVSTNDNNFIDSEFTNLLINLSPSAQTRTQVTTDSNGDFEIKLITPETYQLKVTHPAYTGMIVNDVRVGDGLTTDLGLMKLAHGATVRGTVYGSDGRPAAGYTVSLARTDSQIAGNQQGRTDAYGHFELANVLPGQYKLSAARPRGGQDNPFTVILDMKNSEVEVSLTDDQVLEQDLYMKPE